MTLDELRAFINRRLVEGATGPDTMPGVFPIQDQKFDGIGVAHLPRGEANDSYTATLGPGICIVDDREPGRLGPISFDPLRMSMLLRIATFVAIDSAELSDEIYNELLDKVAAGATVLAVQTTEERHSSWRMYVGMHWHGTDILEIVPVRDNPSKKFGTSVTRFERKI